MQSKSLLSTLPRFQNCLGSYCFGFSFDRSDGFRSIDNFNLGLCRRIQRTQDPSTRKQAKQALTQAFLIHFVLEVSAFTLDSTQDRVVQYD